MPKFEKTALDALRTAFGWLVTGPHPVGLNGSVVGLAPRGLVPLDELRELLLDRRCPRPVKDAAWRELVVRSRRPGRDGAVWTLGAAGVALPALVSVAATCSAAVENTAEGRVAERADLDGAIVAGFIAALPGVDLGAPGIVARLRWAAFRAGQQAARAACSAPAPIGASGDAETTAHRWWFSAGPAPSGDASGPLLAAVAAGVLVPHEAALIAETRLDGATLAEAGHRLGLSYPAARTCRSRAERRLLAYLHPITPTPAEPAALLDPGGTRAVRSARESESGSRGPEARPRCA